MGEYTVRGERVVVRGNKIRGKGVVVGRNTVRGKEGAGGGVRVHRPVFSEGIAESTVALSDVEQSVEGTLEAVQCSL